jgi:hypothetical protein
MEEEGQGGFGCGFGCEVVALRCFDRARKYLLHQGCSCPCRSRQICLIAGQIWLT